MSEVAEGLWSGTLGPDQHHPWFALHELEELDRGVAFVSSFANVAAFDTDDGLVLVDTGSFLLAGQIHAAIRGWSSRPLHTAVFTHGHVDHVFGVGPFEEEARTAGWRRPHVVAHEDLPARFDRYRTTAGWNACINARQFRMPNLRWPTEYRYPDEVYHATHTVTVGGLRLELVHARGETDDHTWVWVPDRRVLCTGDLFIWASPNAGNPQKVQRYPHDWARALRAMQTLDAELLLPGHGYPIRGAARIRQALGETAELLEFLHDRTLEMMNAGATLEEIVHAVVPPPALLARPYLQPVYDEPEFVVRNVWRLYGGWWDGDPAHLKPAPTSALGAEVAALAGGADRLAARALELAAKDELALACDLVELAARGAPDDPEIRRARARIYRQRAGTERSVMARGVYDAAAARDEDA
ncbi:MAG TPA: alkyl sulfatase dimerization domain-containing protein [Candidatus Binatia bacterium]|nr:alkyl sulfatase dimerization domain-containing protein [Candidatus Binatia bacterium]